MHAIAELVVGPSPSWVHFIFSEEVKSLSFSMNYGKHSSQHLIQSMCFDLRCMAFNFSYKHLSPPSEELL